MAEPNPITFIIGDPSSDGHGKSEAHVYDVQYHWKDGWKSKQEVNEFIGFDWSELCSDYQDNYVPEPIIEKLAAKGIDIADFCEHYKGRYSFCEGHEFIELYLTVMSKMMEHPFYFTKEVDDTVKVEIGGYGLFYD